MGAAVSWESAERVATWVAAGRAPLGPGVPEIGPRDKARLESDFAELTVRAEALVVAETGLRPLSGPPRALVVDRGDWARRNITSFRRLLEPVLDRVGSPALSGPLAGVTRTVAGTQLGLVLGWMSTRVLGQYDLLLT